jgi:hypothetical protein
MQILQEQKLAPESSRTSILAVGASRDGLVVRLHEPNEATEPLSASDESVGVAEQVLFLQAAARVINFSVDDRRKQANPPHRNLFVRPCGSSGRVDPQYNVDVVAHGRIGIHSNGKDLGQFQQALLNPLSPMLVEHPVMRIDTTQPGPTHAPRDAVIETRSGGIDKEAAGGGHTQSVA